MYFKYFAIKTRDCNERSIGNKYILLNQTYKTLSIIFYIECHSLHELCIRIIILNYLQLSLKEIY